MSFHLIVCWTSDGGATVPMTTTLATTTTLIRTLCNQKLYEAETKKHLGVYRPICTADGAFESKQCHTSTGYCWCVNERGEEIENTKKRGTLYCSADGEQTLPESIFLRNMSFSLSLSLSSSFCLSVLFALFFPRYTVISKVICEGQFLYLLNKYRSLKGKQIFTLLMCGISS